MFDPIQLEPRLEPRGATDSLDSAMHDDDDETVKGFSDDRHLCWHSSTRSTERRQ